MYRNEELSAGQLFLFFYPPPLLVLFTNNKFEAPNPFRYPTIFKGNRSSQKAGLLLVNLRAFPRTTPTAAPENVDVAFTP